VLLSGEKSLRLRCKALILELDAPRPGGDTQVRYLLYAVSVSKYNAIREEERSLHKGTITLLPGERQPFIPALPAVKSATADH
jgi:hypothetical protein